jgi:hypothetical protein
MPDLFPTKTDVKMTLDGDLTVGGNGDFELTNGFDWLAREINKIVRTVNPLWTIHPTIGAGVESFIGRTNDRETADNLRSEIMDAVERSGILQPGQSVDVEVVPLSMESVSVYVNVNATGISKELFKLIVDYRSGLTAEIPDDAERVVPAVPPRTSTPKNKYLKRIHEGS